ncbi:MAG: hypothetical protein AAF609_14495 [Cyanobacteria bacterium P01_C01_bin.120]
MQGVDGTDDALVIACEDLRFAIAGFPQFDLCHCLQTDQLSQCRKDTDSRHFAAQDADDGAGLRPCQQRTPASRLGKAQHMQGVDGADDALARANED